MLEYSVVFHRTAYNRKRAAKQRNPIAEIFVVPVYSFLSDTPHAYLSFLAKAGALDRAAGIVAAANLDHADTAETTRREVRSIFTAAEVDLLTPPLPPMDME